MSKIIKYQQGAKSPSEKKPTTQDSLQLLENSNAVRKYYDNPKYKDRSGKQSYIYEDDDHMHKDNLEALQYFIQSGREAYTHQDVKILPLGVYYQNIDKNKYKQRETINDILDIRSPMTLYDRRINPRENKYYDNIDPNDPLYGNAINIPMYSRLQLTPINQLTPQERVQRQKLYGVNPGETNYLVQPKKTLQQVSKFVPTSRSESKPIRMTSKPLYTTPQLIPNERVLPEVVYKDNSVPNNAYGKGINVTHFTDSLGRYAAKMNLTTKNGIFGRLSIPNPKGDYRIKYQSGGSTNKLYTASVAPVEIVDSPLGRGKFLLDYEKQNPYRPYTTTNQYLIKYKPDRVALAEASNRAEWERLRNNYADVKMREQERIANIGQSGRVRGMNLTPEQEKNLIQTQSEGRLAWKNKDPLQKINRVAQETSLALVPELMFNQTLKGANVIDNVLPIQPKLTKAFAKGLPGTKPENQRLIKSVMANSPLEKQLNKAGEISVNSILAHINRQDVGDQDKWILNQVLTKHFSGKSKIPYTELQQAVSKEIIPLNQTITPNHSTYGLKALGHNYPSKENYNLAIKNTEKSIAELKSKKFLSPSESKELEEYQNHLNSLRWESTKAPDAKTILFHNDAKFGLGDNTHFPNYDTTLGHARVSNFQDDPNSLYLLENQSDFWQGNGIKGTKDSHKAIFLRNKDTELKMKEQIEDQLDQSGYESLKRFNQLKENELENWEQKRFLGKVYSERFLQEVMDYAAKKGKTSLKFPTRESAIKIQGYTPIDFNQRSSALKNKIRILNSPDQWEPHIDPEDVINSVTGHVEDARFVEKLLREQKEGTINVDLFKQQLAEAQQKLKDNVIEFPHQQETILRRHEEYPKLTKKLFNIEPKIVTDSKENTWYEIPVPKSYLLGKAQIKALSTTPILLGGAAKLSKDR